MTAQVEYIHAILDEIYFRRFSSELPHSIDCFHPKQMSYVKFLAFSIHQPESKWLRREKG